MCPAPCLWQPGNGQTQSQETGRRQKAPALGAFRCCARKISARIKLELENGG
jgi:hypothetical protein